MLNWQYSRLTLSAFSFFRRAWTFNLRKCGLFGYSTMHTIFKCYVRNIFHASLTPDAVSPREKSDAQHSIGYTACVSYALEYRHDFPGHQINRQHSTQKTQKCEDLKLMMLVYHMVVKKVSGFSPFSFFAKYNDVTYDITNIYNIIVRPFSHTQGGKKGTHIMEFWYTVHVGR